MTKLEKEQVVKMEKLDPRSDGTSLDVVSNNIDRIRQLFPEVFAEGKIDFDILRQTLGEHVEDRQERYSFTWHGKSRARRIAQTPSAGTLLPCPGESVNWDTTQNIFIEGDNLEVLKLLQKSYHRKVKMIYIDPPYNTGNEFIYPDKYQDNLDTYLRYTGQVDDEGFKLSPNAETSGRYHTNWLNMMYPRLKLARNLLRDDGVIFVSIDDHECHNLRRILDEIFGEENFVASFAWEKRTNRENRKIVSSRHDHVLCCCRDIERVEAAINQLPMSEEALSRYRNPDNDPRGPWKSDPATAQAGHGTKSQFYVFRTPDGKEHHLQSGRCWLYTKEVMEEAARDGRLWFGKDGNGVPRVKTYLHAKERGLTPESIWFAKDASTNERAKTYLKELFDGVAVFDTPKPVELMDLMMDIGAGDGLVLDFFAGSCSLPEATLRRGGPNRFIAVQLPEECDENSEAYRAGLKTVAEIGKERIRRAISRLSRATEDESDAPRLPGIESGGPVRDLGFKVFRLSTSNIRAWMSNFDGLDDSLLSAVESIESGRSQEDVLYELLLKYGLDLAIPIASRDVAGKQVSIIGAGALVVCLATDVTLLTVEGIAAMKEELKPEVMRVVFRDSAFADDVVKTNTVQILKQAGIDDVKSL